MCLSTLTLRSTENSKVLFEVGIAETIVETMKLHPTSKAVQVSRFVKTLQEFFFNLNFILNRHSVMVLGPYVTWYLVLVINATLSSVSVLRTF